MRIKAKFSWLVVAVVILTACNTISADAPATSLPNTPTKPVISPSQSNTTTPSFSMTPTLTPTVIAITQPALDDIKWATYVFDAGVSFEYPHEWIIMASREDEDSVEFFATAYLPYNVSVDIYQRQAWDNPHSGVPNEGGYEVLWEKPISIENADGLEYIWGIPANNQIGGVLTAIYYSKQHQIQVVLRTDADAVPTESNQFSVFEYMVQSVRIAP